MRSRRVAVAGATGLVGRCLVQQLCADSSVAEVHGLARRPLDWTHAKLTRHVVDFAALPALPPVDEVYLALGTTIRQAGSQRFFLTTAVNHQRRALLHPDGLIEFGDARRTNRQNHATQQRPPQQSREIHNARVA